MNIPWKIKIVRKNRYSFLKMTGLLLAAAAVIHSIPDFVREMKVYKM